MSGNRGSATPWRPAIHRLIGAVLGNYRITGPLDAGAMGNVYRAEHELLGVRDLARPGTAPAPKRVP